AGGHPGARQHAADQRGGVVALPLLWLPGAAGRPPGVGEGDMTRGRAALLAIVIALTIGWVPPSPPVSAAPPGPAPASGVAASPGAEPAPVAAPRPRVVTLAGETPFARPDEAMRLSLDLAGP